MSVMTASETTWIQPFAGLEPRTFAKLVRQLQCEGTEAPRPGRPWSLPLADRVLLVAAYWRTNLTMRQIAALSGTSKSAADDGTLVPIVAAVRRGLNRHRTAWNGLGAF